MNANLSAAVRTALERRLDNYRKSLQHCSAPAREVFQMRVEETLRELELLEVLDRLPENSQRTDDRGRPVPNRAKIPPEEF
jgi:hypothetical protein